jgi:hypothetical protein
MVWIPNTCWWLSGHTGAPVSFPPRPAPPPRCGILTHNNHDLAADGAVRGLDWDGAHWTWEGNTVYWVMNEPESEGE